MGIKKKYPIEIKNLAILLDALSHPARLHHVTWQSNPTECCSN